MDWRTKRLDMLGCNRGKLNLDEERKILSLGINRTSSSK